MTKIFRDVIGASLTARLVLGAMICSAEPVASRPEILPGLSELSGKVVGTKPGLLTTVHALYTDKNVDFMVYVVDGRYRAVDLFPGNYELTVKPAIGQVFTDGFEEQTVKIRIGPHAHVTQNFTLKNARHAPDYVGGMDYTSGWADRKGEIDEQPPSPIAKVLPYDAIYPPGPGRQILERVCMGCHTVQLFPYNFDRTYPSGRPLHDKAGWAATVDRMHKSLRSGKAPNFDAEFLAPQDREVLIDYLAANFGAESEPRAVQLTSEPELDLKALAKAQFVEYRFPNTKELPKRATHTLGFTEDGNVWAMDRGGSLIWLDPRTGDHKDYSGHGGGESLVVDKDGTVWYGGLRHFDAKRNLHDEYRFAGPNGGRSIDVSTLIFDSNGDLWLSLLGTGGIAKFDRRSNTVVWWDVPIYRSRPYGITLDHAGKVWFAQYHNSAVASFDQTTGTFRNYRVTPYTPSNIRRLSADSNNMIWTATWGSPGMQNAALIRLNPQTGHVDEYRLGIPYANPYDTAPNDNDDIWVATDNYLVMFDQKKERFTRYPLTTRTDVPRLSVTAEGAVWFGMRNAGHSGGYGGTAVVLYPDKDTIMTYAARYSDKSVHSAQRRYQGRMTEVSGVKEICPPEPQNPGAYAAAIGIRSNDAAPTPKPLTHAGGAAVE